MSEPARKQEPAYVAESEKLESPPEASAGPSMAWHGFLVHCMLWLAALYHLFQLGYLLSDKMYYGAEVRAEIYAGLPGMRFADGGIALVLAAAAVLQLVARFHLARRRCQGVRLLKWAYGLLSAGMLGYALARLAVSGLSPVSAPLLGQSAAYLALLWLNASYYRKRREAFEPLKGEQR